MTSAHDNLATAFDELAALVEAMDTKLDALLREREERLLRPTEAAAALQHHKGYFSPGRYPWRVPGFGASGSRHPLEAWREWNLTNHRKEWDKLPRAERERLLERVA